MCENSTSTITMNDNRMPEYVAMALPSRIHNGSTERRRGQSPLENEEASPTYCEDDFLKNLFDQTVHGACQMPTICHGSIEDQLDVFMNCRQPLAMFSFFRENKTRESAGVEILPAGAYVLPTFCEYCKSPNTRQCPPHCERPKLYFQKKRPPFQKLDPNLWNPQTDFALTAEEKADLNTSASSSDMASLASTSGSSSGSRSKGYQNDFSLSESLSPSGLNQSFESGTSPRQGQVWLGMWSASE